MYDLRNIRMIYDAMMVYDARKALLPTYSVLDGAKALLESHRIGKGIVGGIGARAFLPGKAMYDVNVMHICTKNA